MPFELSGTKRSGNPTGASEVALKIPRTARHLIVDLPIGSKEGSYDLALLNEAGDEVSRATGTATLEDHVVILRADIDIRNLSPGFYFIGLRQLGLEWSRYAIGLAHFFSWLHASGGDPDHVTRQTVGSYIMEFTRGARQGAVSTHSAKK